MNIYSRKRKWKGFLLLFAFFIVIISLWYTNGFINNIAKNEKSQVELWANAISRKAELVKSTENLFENLRKKEKTYVYIWSKATQRLITAEKNDDIDFYTNIITGNNDIPVIVTNEEGEIIWNRNLDSLDLKIKNLPKNEASIFTEYPAIKIPLVTNKNKDKNNYLYYKNSKTYYKLKNILDDLTKSFLDEIVNNRLSTPVIVTDTTKKQVIAYGGNISPTMFKDSIKLSNLISKMESEKTPILIKLPTNGSNLIFYSDSPTLTRIKYFPIILFLLIALFLIISYVLFSIFRKSEQNQVWAGMAKETAHQLGTPISSLIGWIEVMKLKYVDEVAFLEMEKDTDRLILVSERFSKIGSKPALLDGNIVEIISSVVEYMQTRTSNKININLLIDRDKEIIIKVNKQLIIWVFENIIRNAVDAIGNNAGKIEIYLETKDKTLIIDIKDTGKGIPAAQQKQVFSPGFSTKTRGWGLGLSLSKRIIEQYHKGKIFVKSSSLGQGTVFRIILKK